MNKYARVNVNTLSQTFLGKNNETSNNNNTKKRVMYSENEFNEIE